MQIIETNHLISILIAIDIVFFVFLILFFRRLTHIRRNTLLVDEIETFEAIIRDSDETAGQFNQQLKNKVAFIKKLNRKIDKRINSLNLLLNRSNIVLSEYSNVRADDPPNDKDNQVRRQEILKLAKNGHPVEAIARKLAIPRGEVMLTLNLHDSDVVQPLNRFKNQMANEVNPN
jgi:hypothetical protein